MHRIVSKVINGIVFAAVLLVRHSVQAAEPSGSACLDGGASKVGVILCHGQNQYPTWKVVDLLRKGIHEQLGCHTLSLQTGLPPSSWGVEAVLAGEPKSLYFELRR
jgi:hypothetical protein